MRDKDLKKKEKKRSKIESKEGKSSRKKWEGEREGKKKYRSAEDKSISFIGRHGSGSMSRQDLVHQVIFGLCKWPLYISGLGCLVTRSGLRRARPARARRRRDVISTPSRNVHSDFLRQITCLMAGVVTSEGSREDLTPPVTMTTRIAVRRYICFFFFF